MKPISVITAGVYLLFLSIPIALTAPKLALHRAVFHSNGSIQIPVGYRQWVHVGTRYKSSGSNLLDGSTLVTPQIMNIYVEPSAMEFYRENASWPDGAQIVKEFSEIKTGKGCDPHTRVCSTALGSGIFESGFSGLAMMVKDKERYPEDAGNWAYFGFGHQPPPYKTSAQPFPRQQCADCHIRNAAATGYVFATAHIGLSAQ